MKIIIALLAVVVMLNIGSALVEGAECGGSCSNGLDCLTLECPHCKDGVCSACSAQCGEACPTGNSYECCSGGLCTNNICSCPASATCLLSREPCTESSDCCKGSCSDNYNFGSLKTCA